MQMLLPALLVCLLAPAATVAQGNPPKATPAPAKDNPLSGHNKVIYGTLKNILLRAAEKMPEENYSFRPADGVRTYGQLVGHLADAQYFFCSAALGEKNPALNIEKTKTSKADLIAALKEAVAYCDRAYGGMTDASGAQAVKFMGTETPRLGVLNVNNFHNASHYGNLVTYMRMKNIVPPSSEPGFLPEPRR